MKRVFKMLLALVLTLTLLFSMNAMVFATDNSVEPTNVIDNPIDDWFSFEFLGTFIGMVTAVTVLTQVLKTLPFNNNKIDPKWYSLASAIILGIGLQLIYKKDFTPEGVFMMAVNILLVYATSIGVGYETIFKPLQRKVEKKRE